MAVRDDFAAGEVLAAADLNDTFASKLDTTVTTKGDLVSYGTAPARLGVGTDGQVLTADSSETLGMKWAAGGDGLVLITSQSFTSASSLVFNNVFSATYTSYKIVYFFTSNANVTADVRMRVGGTTTSGGTDYAWSRVFISGTSNTTNNGGSTGASSGVFANATDNARGVAGAWDVIRPFAAAATSWTSLGNYSGLGEWGFIVHGAATSYDGFEITGGGSKTGTIKVYGYKD